MHPVLELEARQDQVLRELDELERRVEIALREFLIVRDSESAGIPASAN
jgi:hypothetical protein